MGFSHAEPSYTCANNAKAYNLLGWEPTIQPSEGVRRLIRHTIQNQVIAIGVAMHNNATTIRRCLQSILDQQGLRRQLEIVLANDNSSDNWRENVSDLLHDERIIYIDLANNNVVKTRNAINRYISDNIHNCVLIGRLDADDEYSSDFELVKIEEVLDKENPDIISAGNYLRQDGQLIRRTNPTDKRLAEKDYLLYRLEQMSRGVDEGELPSCNLYIRPHCLLPYPDVKSGEDHALFVHYLLQADTYRITFAEDLKPVIYNLGGKTTSENRKFGNYINCRIELYKNAIEQCRMN